MSRAAPTRPKKAARGKGSFVQTRRLDTLRAALETQTHGHTLDELASFLGVTERSVRRYLGQLDRKSTRLNSSHCGTSRMPSSA